MEEVAPNVQNKSGRKIKVKTNTFFLTAILLTAKHRGSEYEIEVL